MNKKRTTESTATGVSSKKVKMNNLENKVDEETGFSRCFHLVKSRMYLSLAPCHMNAPLEGIKSQHLNQLVMQYNRDLDGIIVGYRGVELITEEFDEDTILAKVSEENPFTFIWVNVEFIVWAPKVGDVLEGYCIMQSRGHIGLLINDVFNATIRKRNIPSNWEFVPNQQDESETEGPTLGHWVDDSSLPIDGKLKFTVRSIQAAGKSISVEGTLLGKGEEADEQPLELNLGLDEIKSSNGNTHMKFDDDEAVNITIDGVEVSNKEKEEEEEEDEAIGYAKSDSEAKSAASDSESESEQESESD